MLFKDGSQYLGPFVNDVIDMSQNGHIEDYNNSMFRVMGHTDENGVNMSGQLHKGKLQNQCAVDFQNGDRSLGMFKDGKPNGPVDLFYKYSVPMQGNSGQYEQA